MKKLIKEYVQNTSKSLMSLNKLIKVLYKNDIYFFAINAYAKEPLLIIEPNGKTLEAIFNVTSREIINDFEWVKIDFDNTVIILAINN